MNARQPGRLDRGAPCAGPRLPPNAEPPRPALFGVEKEREPGVFAALLVREAGLKNRCDAGGTLRTADRLAKRPDGLKLSREGDTGILPVTRLAFRNDTLLIGR